MIRMTNKPQFVGERVRLGKLLLDTFSGEWGTEEGESLTPVLRTSNFNEDGSLDYSTPAIRCIPERKVAKKRMFRGDIILEKSGGTPKRPVGIMAFYDSDELALCSNFNQVLRFDEDRILSRFAFHQLRWLKDRNAFDRFTRKTTGLQNLQMKKLIELKLHVPQIEAQTTIADTLDKIVDNQRTLQREIINLDSLVKSRFVEMFGDPATADAKHKLLAIGNFADVQTGATPLRRESKYYGGSIPWVKTGEVARNFANGVEENITETAIKETNCKVFPAGAVLVAMYGQGDTRGKAAILPFEAATNQACAAIMPSPAHNEVFLNAQLQLLYEDMRAKSLGGNQKNLSLGIIKSMKVIMPPMEAQQEFATFVSQVDKSRFIAQQQIEKLQMLYDSLAQEYFGD